jgi:general secretion pathway protein A
MYENYYGFAEKPFSLTPDPRYLYRSESHANAFDLLQYAIRRREGFVAITGDIGTGKTTLCRALLEQIDRTTFTALVLNPFLTEEELLKRILQDFGVVSRDDAKGGRLATATKQELIDTLYDFLLSLVALKASAVLIIDEAQNLPMPVLEQIRILSNLETDKEKLLQIILVGQLELQAQLRAPELRQLDQRISIRYELQPLDRDSVAAYIAHRLTVAGAATSVSFSSDAIDAVHRFSGGIPRLINLICDRALLAGFSAHAPRIGGEHVTHAANGLDLGPATYVAKAKRRRGSLQPRASLLAAASLALAASATAVGATAWLYERFASSIEPPVSAASRSFAIVIGAYPSGSDEAQQVADWVLASGLPVNRSEVDLGTRGRWQRILAGAYTDPERARHDAERLKAAAAIDGRIVIQPNHEP